MKDTRESGGKAGAAGLVGVVVRDWKSGPIQIPAALWYSQPI